jgi:hypothetical protein
LLTTSATGYGGEAISLAVESKISKNFRKAGYAEIHTNESYVGGYVRQYGKLSFSRVLDAGHESKSLWILSVYRHEAIANLPPSLLQHLGTNPKQHIASSTV